MQPGQDHLLVPNTSRFQYFLRQKYVVYFPAFGYQLSLKKMLLTKNMLPIQYHERKDNFSCRSTGYYQESFMYPGNIYKKFINFFLTDQIIIVQVKGLPAVLNFLFSCAKCWKLLLRRHGCSKFTSKPNLTKCNFLVTDEKAKCNRRLLLNQYRASATEVV